MGRRNNQRLAASEQGFTLIEILVGVLILSLAISAFSAALSHSYRWQNRQRDYEILSVTGASIVNSLVASPRREPQENRTSGRGELNEVGYSWRCATVLSAFNVIQTGGLEAGGVGRTLGNYRTFLEECTIELRWQGATETLQFYRSRYARAPKFK